MSSGFPPIQTTIEAMSDRHAPTPETDDEDWLALLAGKPAPDADARTRQDAEILRQAVLRRQAQAVEELSDADLARGRERLQFQLRRTMPSSTWNKWRHPALWAGLAAGLVGIVILPLWWLSNPPLPETHPVAQVPPKFKRFRMPSMVRADQPAAAAQAMADSLRRMGIATQPIQQAGRWLIDAPVPDPPPAALTPLLTQYKIRPPADRRLLVEFIPKATESAQ